MTDESEYIDYLESPELWIPKRVVPNDTDLDLDADQLHRGMYHSFELPKDRDNPAAGTRTVTAPLYRLKRAQYRILESLIACGLKGSNVAHAYYRGRSIKTMAAPHIGKRSIVKMDISNFFPSIRVDQVRRVLRGQRVPQDLINRVVKWCFLDGGLPVGAPTSPVLSNLVGAYFLDKRLLGLVSKWRTRQPMYQRYHRYEPIAYTRYADDLVFSSDYRHLNHIINVVRYIIQDAGFRVNEDKIVTRTNGGRQTVVGITVNQKMSKPRSYRSKLRARMYHWSLDIALNNCPPGIRRRSAGSNEMVEINLQRIEGQINHVASVAPEQAVSLREQFDLLTDLCKPEGQRSLLTSMWVDRKRGGHNATESVHQ